MPLYSTVVRDCVEKGTDVTAGGSRYASTALSMVAPATFVDSLYSVKTLCYDEQRLTVKELLAVLERDYEGEEALRQYIIKRIPKYCSGNEELDGFARRVLHDIGQVSGQTNGRGGKYYPAFYPHEIFRPLGERTAATPDGRKKGFPLSRGTSPSEFLSGITPTDMLRSVSRIDFTDFTDSFALEVTLPVLDTEIGMTVLPGLVKGFLQAKGSTLQFNLLDISALRDAQLHPEQHRDLLVRICGYSFYFVNLSKEAQDEVIARAVRSM
jgi:formate C-acetyltransferase